MNKLQHWWEFQEPMKLVEKKSFIIPSKLYNKEKRNKITQNDRSETSKKTEQQKPFQEAYLRDMESSNDIKKVTTIIMISKQVDLNESIQE